MSASLRFDREEIVFKNKGNVNRLFSKLILKNSSENFIGYQIKGNNVKRYIISKPLGKIKPYSTLEVNIEMTLNARDLESINSNSDKFCCFYMYIDDEDADKSESELQAILKTKKQNKTIHKLKIRSRIGGAEDPLKTEASHKDQSQETPVFEQVLKVKQSVQINEAGNDEGEEEDTEEIKMGFNANKTVYSGGFKTRVENAGLKDSMDVDSEMKKIMGGVKDMGVSGVKSCLDQPLMESLNKADLVNTTKANEAMEGKTKMAQSIMVTKSTKKDEQYEPVKKKNIVQVT